LHQLLIVRINFDITPGDAVQNLPVHENHWQHYGC
jgi:hypothetical protein